MKRQRTAKVEGIAVIADGTDTKRVYVVTYSEAMRTYAATGIDPATHEIHDFFCSDDFGKIERDIGAQAAGMIVSWPLCPRIFSTY